MPDSPSISDIGSNVAVDGRVLKNLTRYEAVRLRDVKCTTIDGRFLGNSALIMAWKCLLGSSIAAGPRRRQRRYGMAGGRSSGRCGGGG